MNDRKCLECFEQLRGRADQKFCNDQCRSGYNNRKLVDANKMIRTINRILKKNYFILSALNPGAKSAVHKSDLQKRGYRFDYFTCKYTQHNSKTYYFCYDLGYSELENDKMILARLDVNGELMVPRN